MGYGRRLLNKCMEELKQYGFSKVLLWVLEDNHRARKFYEKNGFVYSGVFIDKFMLAEGNIHVKNKG